ncbi:MAG: DUF1015 domain-containing protein [Treponema sp.]|jgi:hypothetical protein|nr:DUF1015 domain-containing protein [Treponema sp.]
MQPDQRLAALGIAIPEIVLPRPGVDLKKWAVIACDQFTQDQGYWETVQNTVGAAPSALKVILPEIYLEAGGRAERIRRIHQTMDSYLAEGILTLPRRGCIYLERSTPYHPLRRGVVVAVDLEQYDWKPEAQRLIRATEGTVPERLPPRMAIRRGAPLEIPHVILLIDDEADSLLPGLGERAKKGLPVYNTPLLMDSGVIAGWFLDQEADWAYLADALEGLVQNTVRYGTGGDTAFLYAVGDGNHSLAAAKAVWEEYKAAHTGTPGLMDHPSRWAMVEVENLYDPGINFEPIHRLLFGPDLTGVLDALAPLPGFSSRPIGSGEELSRLVGDPGVPQTRLGLIAGAAFILIETEAPGLATESLQPLLDALVKSPPHKGVRYSIDYIHGETGVFQGNPEHPAVGILLPPIKKSGLFKTVARSGPLPRKSFSIGEAHEKRFYLDCRKLF